MSRTPGLDDIPLDVFRGIVAFGMGRFTVGRLDGGMKVCGPEFEAWSEPPCECERCTFEADRGRDKEFIRFDYYCDCYDTDILLLRLGLACDAVLAQLPLNKHGRNPSNYGETKVH